MDSMRWGILGTGRIGHEFAVGLRDTPDAETLGRCSRITSGRPPGVFGGAG